jgi:hypothetical protein
MANPKSTFLEQSCDIAMQAGGPSHFAIIAAPRCCPRLKHVPAKWNPVRRQGHAPNVESAAFSVHIGSRSERKTP